MNNKQDKKMFKLISISPNEKYVMIQSIDNPDKKQVISRFNFDNKFVLFKESVYIKRP
ncbi:hypothetical protein P4H67_25930 [Paenibacillus lautus]|uniref:hypothetical protein n=1 Tax=Paenibacillus lautus TaxID=1401 RepID=UPI002DB915BF|nr:hypothetical protein [Paenibacillus lautus]MEC0310199.1 hypothetical protein [Paenibacillus lautus]